MRAISFVWSVALLVAAATPAAFALDGRRAILDYPIDFWKDGSGLPQNRVNVLLQTRDGYLWVGTRGGLARFDGVRFTVYNREQHQLTGNEVAALAEAPDGSLWIGLTGDGLNHLLPDGRIESYGVKDGLAHDQVQALAIGPDGSVWIGTPRGLTRRHPDGHFSTYRVDDGLPGGLVAGSMMVNIRSLAVDRRGVIWIGALHGLASYSNGRFASYSDMPGNQGNWIEKVLVDEREGGLWLSHWNAGLVRWKDGHAERVTADDWAPARAISDLSFDTDGTLWLSTNAGLYRYRAGRFEAYVSSVQQAGAEGSLQAVSLESVKAVLGDREGNVWIGMTEDGLARLRDTIVTTVSVGSVRGIEERINAVLEDEDGTMWFGLSSGEIVRLRAGVMTRFAPPRPGPVLALARDAKGTLWAGTWWDPVKLEHDRLVPVPMDNIYKVGRVLADRNGDLWFGGRHAGLVHRRGDTITHYLTKNGLPSQEITDLALDAAGRLWIASRNGIVMKEGDTYKTYSTEQGLPNRFVTALYFDAKNVLWVTTRHGLARMENGRLFVFTAEHGVPEDHFYAIVEDDLDHLWLTHGRGVLRVSKSDLDAIAQGRGQKASWRTFGSESGLKSTSMADRSTPGGGHPAAWKSRDGRVWFATQRGMAVFDPTALTRNTLPPPVNIEEIQVDRVDALARPEMRFPPGSGDVEIRYTGLSLVDPHRVRFRYRLEGVDGDWIDAGARRVAYYTKLPPGSYRFHVRACNNDGVWNEGGLSVVFHLMPHWYQTVWFRLAAATLVLLGLAALYRSRVRGHERRERELRQRVDEALKHLKMLRGLLPICASCKKIRDDSGYWNQMETYISDHSDADFSHSVCPDCLAKLYPDYVASAATGGVPPADPST